jgi:hypothetical protein
MIKLKLLGVGTNAKTKKGDGSEYTTAILYLASSDQVLKGLCPMSKIAMCDVSCLYTAGRGRMNSVQAARIRKTVLLRDDPEEFERILRQDLDRFQAYCLKKNIQPVVRLNGTSDKWWLTIIKDYPLIQFYDYTKVYNRVAKQLPENYHLTLSYSEANPIYKDKIIEYGTKYKSNIAVVFRDKNNIPSTFLGRKVISGDNNDLRFLDPTNVVVALYAKGLAKKDQTGFVID